MHLYKPACADIPPPKPGPPRGRRVSRGPRAHGPAAGWPGARSPSAERKQLERFLHLHGLSLHDSTRAQSGMRYR